MKRYDFNLPNGAIKPFVDTVSGIMGFKPRVNNEYCRWEFGEAFFVDEHGDITFADTIADASISRLIEKIAEKGYGCTKHTDAANERPVDDGSSRNVQDAVTVVRLDRRDFTPDAITNLQKLLEAKGELIRRALCLDNCEISVDDTAVSFPWLFSGMPVQERFYVEQFIRKVCAHCITSTRINAKSKDIENEKFAMRTFCNRIGMVGEEYRGARQMLMRNLEGDAAWKHGRPQMKR